MAHAVVRAHLEQNDGTIWHREIGKVLCDYGSHGSRCADPCAARVCSFRPKDVLALSVVVFVDFEAARSDSGGV